MLRVDLTPGEWYEAARMEAEAALSTKPVRPLVYRYRMGDGRIGWYTPLLGGIHMGAPVNQSLGWFFGP